MQFAGYTTSVAITTGGKSVSAPVTGEDQTAINIVRFY